MNKVKHLFLIPLFVIAGMLFSFQKTALKTTNNGLEKTIFKVIKAFEENDEIALNKLILRDKGLIILFRPGSMDRYIKINNIDFTNPIPSYLPYSSFQTSFKLVFESLPTFDCGTMNWSKNGLYCDTTKRSDLLSRTAINLKNYAGEKGISDVEINAFKQLEKYSRRIVLSDNEKGELIFYLTLVNKKWYLTILDRVSSDCSA